MGNGDIVVGKNGSGRKSASPKSKDLEKDTRTTSGAQERSSGAMSQQRSDSGAVSTPQKFLHLVGCRDRKGRPPSGH